MANGFVSARGSNLWRSPEVRVTMVLLRMMILLVRGVLLASNAAVQAAGVDMFMFCSLFHIVGPWHIHIGATTLNRARPDYGL